MEEIEEVAEELLAILLVIACELVVAALDYFFKDSRLDCSFLSEEDLF